MLRSTVIAAVCLLAIYSCKQRGNGSDSNPILNSVSIKPLTEAIAADTGKADAWFKRGLALHKQRQDSLALEDFYHAARIDTNKAVYASTIGDLLFEHKDVTNAVFWLLRALRHDPNDTKAHLKMAKMMLFTKDYPGAFSEINTVLRQDTYNPEGYFLKGIVYKEMKDTSKAISSFQTVINVAPDYREAAIQLGLLYCAQNNALGLQYLNNAFRLDTNDVFPLYARGMYFQQRKEFESAKREYSNCILHDTQYADAIFANGFILLQQDSLEKAKRQFDLVTKISPNNPAAYYNRGLCSELLGDKQNAANDYRQALTFDKNYQTASVGLKRIGATGTN